MEFPHLDDTRFPLLDNVNVYSYRNEFDYTRWIPNTKVKLTNVLWNGSYRDVVNFADNASRDAWFDSHEGMFEVTLKSNHSIPPEGGIKLPIPYDVAARYNYMVVDIPIMTSASAPIEYEDVQTGVRRWFFFVDEISSRAPNTTMFQISLDVWTQFQNDVDIRYMFLERGHAPVAATDTDEYLSNPIANNDLLLTPDVTPTTADVIRKSSYIPFGNGHKWVCIATYMGASTLTKMGFATASSDYTSGGTITYSDVSAYYGNQLQVDGYGVGNGYSYAGMSRPVDPHVTYPAHAWIPNNLSVWAIPSEDVYGDGQFFNDVLRLAPQFFDSIQGCFVVDESMIDLENSPRYTFCGHEIALVNGTSRNVSISLAKEDFGFPERYQRFAKLYTFPYSRIELTDNEGKTVDVRVENTGQMQANLITSVAFPFIKTRMFFTGINGSGSESYAWFNLWNQRQDANIANSDWFEYCFDHEIPCYALYMDGETAWYLRNFNSSVDDGRHDALVAYHNAVRPANTVRENVLSQNATAYTNTDADATTLTNNTANTTNTARANMDATIATNAAKSTRANQTSSLITGYANDKAFDVSQYANYTTTQSAGVQNETTAAVSKASANGEIAAAGLGGIAAGTIFGVASAAGAGAAVGGAGGTAAVPGAGTLVGAAGGAVVGAVVGLASAVVNASVASDNASVVVQGNTAAATAVANNNSNSTQETIQYNDQVVVATNNQRSDDTLADNNLLDANTDRSNANLTQNAANNAATMRANMNRTVTTGNLVATRTRDVAIMNAKETLENTRHGIDARLKDAALAPASVIGSYAGDPTADYMRTRGVQMRVRTMPDAEVRQVGDWFARFGYALEQVWNVSESGLCPMRNFYYWKCRDIWIDDRASSNNAALDIMSTIFERGVTIWNDPEKVGKVSVYDN